MYVIGTAGHVDHGKSTLVQALTGIDPDRLREEKARGMTIDLGFAWLTLPGGAEVSLVDVPGHERFIKNMLAGVGGIDLALLVIAADEGVMPQTREHLAIIDLLRVRAGVVAITKADLVDTDWLDLVVADVQDTLAGTVLANAPVVACSAHTRAGLPALLATLEDTLARTEPKRDIGRPRLSIDRAFTVAGFGTVVTGTLIDGALHTGQEVVVEPGGLRSRIRGLQSHRTKLETARPGSRVAVNLAGLAVEDLHRGQVLTVPGWLRPATAIDVSLRAVSSTSHPLRHNASVTFHSGSAEVEAKVRLLDHAELLPGEAGWAQLRLAAPAALAPGDGFVLRSPNETVGGGQVVDVHARRHRRHDPALLNTLTTLAEGAPEDALYTLIARSQGADLATLARQTEGGEDRTRALVAGLVAAGRVVALPPGELARTTVVFTSEGLEARWQRARETLSAYFREHPLRTGMPREELKSRLAVPTRLYNELLAYWVGSQQLIERAATVAVPGHQVSLTPEQAREAEAFCRSLLVNRYAPAIERPPSPELLGFLAEQGRIVVVSDTVMFDAEVYREMVGRITAHLTEQRTITLAQVRDLFGASRKYAQALLEHLDSRGLTRRVGDERVLRV